MNTFETLVERNNLTLTEEGDVLLNPISQFEFVTFPLSKENLTLAVTKDVYYGLLLKVYQFNADLKGVEPFDPVQFNEFRKIKFAALLKAKAEQETKAVENGATD